MLYLLCLKVALFLKKKKGFFSFLKWIFFLKKWPDVRPDERLTSGVRRQPHPT
jgi:hypothetical protein